MKLEIEIYSYVFYFYLLLVINDDVTDSRNFFTLAVSQLSTVYLVQDGLYTAKNTVISPDFLVWKFCGKAQFSHSYAIFCSDSVLVSHILLIFHSPRTC